MKDFYKINEIAKLFALHPDTLRYYEEKGLLHPVRGENGYRMYSIQDLCNLNIIRSLRDLGMTLADIRAYLDRRTVAATLDLIDAEQALLHQRIEMLETVRRETETRKRHLLRCGAVEDGQVTLAEVPERPYVFLREDIILEGEIDFLLKKLESRHQDYIQIIGNQRMGAILDRESLETGIYNHFSRVFFLTAPGQPYDAVLPAGRYASLCYRGPYTALEGHFHRLLAGIEALGLRPTAPPQELYHVDAHDTNVEAEYLTELQMRVE